jgi:DNA repair protein RecO
MLRNQKDKAIVINLKPLKDANKLVFVFSPIRGKLTLSVRGAGKSLSKLAPSLDGGNIVEISYYKGKSDIDLLLEVKLIDDLSNLKSIKDGIPPLLYILELINSFIQPEMPLVHFFKETQDTLQLIDSNNNLMAPAIAYFQLLVLDSFGYEPPLDVCSICSKRLIQDESKVAIINEGIGYMCQDHIGELDNSLIIKDNILKVQKYLLKINAQDIKAIALSNAEWQKLLFIQNTWLQNVLEKKVIAFNMLKING